MRDWLLEARSKKGLTMIEVAEKLNISESYYSLIEKGDRQKKMDIALASALAVVLNVPLEKIIKMENDTMKPSEPKSS